MKIIKKRKEEIEFEKEYKEWPEYAKKAQHTRNGKIRKAEKGTYKRYIQEKPYILNGNDILVNLD